MSDEPEIVAPLDAYATAKPDEPVFTLQGGDPLAGPLVRLWACMARRRAGVAGKIPADDLTRITTQHQAPNEREATNLLVRATAAEEVSWMMDSYLRGEVQEKVEIEEVDGLDDQARIDLHDFRVRSAQKLSDMVANLIEISDELHRRGHHDGVPAMKRVAHQIKNIAGLVEPRRIMKKGPVNVGQRSPD